MADFATSDNAMVQVQLNRIAALSPGRDILGLERIAALMQVLGEPHKNLPPVFHVAGTNGKGSTCAFLRSTIEASGQSVHVYSSPHLVRFNERIRIAGTLISDNYLAIILAQVLDAAQAHDLHPSFFEVTTAAAFVAFAQNPADACIIEVGLGGRLDATNIIEHPAVCGIANLGIDHEAFLLSPEDGTPDDPMTRIAWEKAGIAKKDMPLVVGDYNDDMNAIIAQHAAKIGAPLWAKKIKWDAAPYDGKLHYRDERGKLTLPLPRMQGPHQCENAALAIAMLRHQNDILINETAMAAAMEWTQWPARLQRLSDGPLTRINPNIALWLDGGHNVNAGHALAQHFANDSFANDSFADGSFSNDRDDNASPHIHLIIGMLSNKDPSAIIKPLSGYIKSISVLPIHGHDHHDVSSFAALTHIVTTKQDSLQNALSAINITADDIILIAGSLYLAGEALAANEQAPD